MNYFRGFKSTIIKIWIQAKKTETVPSLFCFQRCVFFSFLRCLVVKYRKFVRPEDKYLASILIDGLHQHVGLGQFIRLKRELPVSRVTLLDNYINPLDVLSGIYWLLRGSIYSLSTKKKKYVFLEFHNIFYLIFA